MSLSQDIYWDAGKPDEEHAAGQDDREVEASALIDFRKPLKSLDDIEEPSAEDLAELEDGLIDELALETDPLAMLAAALETPIEKPELVSLESLDELDDEDEMDDELDDEDDFSDPPADSYIDMDIDSADLNDEGYDLDDGDDISDYHDLYGEDDSIIPSFREDELDDDDSEGSAAYYDDLR